MIPGRPASDYDHFRAEHYEAVPEDVRLREQARMDAAILASEQRQFVIASPWTVISSARQLPEKLVGIVENENRVEPKRHYGQPKTFFDVVADTLDEMIRMCDEAIAYDPLARVIRVSSTRGDREVSMPPLPDRVLTA